MTIPKNIRTICQSYTPFTNIPGTPCLLPGTDVYVVAYPTKIEVYGFDEKLRAIATIYNHGGMVEKFQVLLDLKRGIILVEGKAPSGFYRVEITPGELCVKKGKVELDVTQFECKVLALASFEQLSQETLSFGVHKALLWQKVEERMAIQELLPLFYAATRFYNEVGAESNTQLANLDSITSPASLEKAIQCFFKTGFHGLFVPTQLDKKFSGHTVVPSHLPGAVILGTLHQKIRAFFIQESAQLLTLLPRLPKSIIAGRFINCCLMKGHKLSFEWTKGKLRRLVIEAKAEDNLFIASQELVRCRIRKSKSESGKVISLQSSLHLQTGISYLLDKFEK